MSEAILSTDPDHELLRRFVEGDRAAFDRLVERWHRPIVRFLTRLVGNGARAEELAQEAFVRAFRSAGGFKGQYRFSTWIYTIARNCARSDLKRRSRERASASGVPVEDVARPSAERSGPFRTAERRELAAIVRRAIDTLDDDHRTALLLTFYQGLSYEEAAEVMGRPRGTVKSWVFRAKRRLAKTLSDWKALG